MDGETFGADVQHNKKKKTRTRCLSIDLSTLGYEDILVDYNLVLGDKTITIITTIKSALDKTITCV